MEGRIFKEGVPQHVYIRGKGGGIVFYCLEDCIFYVTLYHCLARRYGIVTTAFCIMPNHTHSQQRALSRRHFSAFNRDMVSVFTQGYNLQHKRRGQLFDKPFGSSPKSVGKTVKANISYICNNGAEGRLSKGVLDYRWNLMAYCICKAPFSESVALRHASRRLRRAMTLVGYFHDRGMHLDYKAQELVFKGLGQREKRQVTDFILSQYNVLDKSGIARYFGSIGKALAAMETNCGSEHDLKEDWDDYSVYRRLGKCVAETGLDLKTANFEMMDRQRLMHLKGYLKGCCTASERQIDKFLHITKPGTAVTRQSVRGR